MRVLTISEADDAGAVDAEPLLVVPVTRPLLRRVLDLVVEHVAPSGARPTPRPGVLSMRTAPPGTPESVPDRTDP
jgi:hypothetical protein